MKKIILFVLTLACLAGIYFLVDNLFSVFDVFKNAFGEVDQWKTLM